VNASIQPASDLNTVHRNQYLFSDHYLNNLLPDDPRWAAALPEAKAFLAWLQGLYAQKQAQLPHYTESQLKDHWFEPILAQLGHVFKGRASTPGLNAGVKWPAYVFFPDEAARQAAVGAQKIGAYAAAALAVGKVSSWSVPPGKKQSGGGASFEAQNPSWQIDYYVRITGLDWGILSNGRLWRLVHKETSQRLSIYYEVDLVDLLTRGDAEAMCYFTFFFHQAAFRPNVQGRVFLQDALVASNAYAVALEEDLKQNVYHALERLIQGFLDLPANGLEPALSPWSSGPRTEGNAEGDADLSEVYDNSLYLLYRLLFILYGESRGLLPVQNDPYRTSYSLARIKKDIAALEVPPAPTTTVYWSRLRNLFHIIHGGDPELNRLLGVPRYDGGLFDPQLHPFLEQKAVGDRALVEAIDLLCRRDTPAGREFVDYRTLSVRHLGAIYEGLLECRPCYAGEPMAAIRDRRGERWVKANEIERPPRPSETSEVWPKVPTVIERRDAGQVYLETDRGERKASGSYYTPQYIVEYIVENTLGPLVDEAVERVKAQANHSRPQAAQSLAGEILSLKVLDPAMGSGHFLVEATEFLARRLATVPRLETDAPTEDDLIYWRLRVVERCIYGVDKNPLAVELARLSLWLTTMAADRPLSFLDHHLKSGDSLVGTRVASLGWAPPVALSKLRTKGQKQLAQQKAGQVSMFEWELAFPEVFCDRYGQPLGNAAGFDAVVGNPPWVGHKTASLDGTLEGLFVVPGERLDTYILFFDRALQLIRHGGRVGTITPNTYLNNKSALSFRKYLCDNTAIETLIDLPKRTFEDAPDVCPAVTILSPGIDKTGYYVGTGSTCAIDSATAKLDYRNIRGPDYFIPVNASFGQVTDLIEKIESGSAFLSNYAVFQKGVETGNDKEFLTQEPEKEGHFPWLHGREISRYEISSDGWYVKHGAHLKNPQRRELLSQRKIVIQYIRKLTLYPRIVAALDRGGFFPSYGTVVCLVTTGKPGDQFLLALLNSNLLNFYYQHIFHDIAVKAQYLYQLPIRRIAFTTPAGTRAALLEKGQRLYEVCLTRGDQDCVTGFAVNQLCQKPERADVIHDLLAYLAGQMIEMHEQRQAAAKAFWLDLEGVTEAATFQKLRHKGKQERTLWKRTDACHPFVRQESHSTRTLDESLAWSEDAFKTFVKALAGKVQGLNHLVGVYRAHSPAYGELVARIATTDRLIDQVVYQLYGLTEGESVVVEGKASRNYPAPAGR